jgi:hypothetical protein
MKTYIIDNGLSSTRRVVYFVEAPEDFGEWFTSILCPWLKSHDVEISYFWWVAGICSEVEWTSDRSSTPFQEFLDEEISAFDYTESPPTPRPKYHMEKD